MTKKPKSKLTNSQIAPVHTPKPLHPPLRWRKLIPRQHLGEARQRREARLEPENEQREGNTRVVAKKGGDRPEG